MIRTLDMLLERHHYGVVAGHTDNLFGGVAPLEQHHYGVVAPGPIRRNSSLDRSG